MRAAVLREYNAPLSIETVPDPACPDDGVVLKVLACGVCRSDWHAWTGADPDVVLPMVPVQAGPRSDRMSPNRLEATTTSNQSGCSTNCATRISI